MAEVMHHDISDSGQKQNWSRRKTALVIFAVSGVIFLISILGYIGIRRLPVSWILPFDVWFQNFFDFIRGNDERFGLINITRFLSAILEWILDATSNLLYGRNRWPYFGPIPWSAIAAALTVLAYYLGGRKIAILVLATCLWIAIVGQWEIAMQTMSVIVVAAPISVLIGLFIGIAAWKWRGFERFIKPVLSILQSLPFFTYLLPAVIFFKVGPTAGAVATIAFSMPPMILMTTLGLHKVPSDIVEAGQMSGSTRRQMLWKVYLPAARNEILVGVNQVIMLSLAMVVLTAFIGMPGLGAKLLSLMNSLKLGRSVEIGITIVLIAISLDQCSKAWIIKQPMHFEKGASWFEKHRFLVIGLVAFFAFYLISFAIPYFAEVPREMEFSLSGWIDKAIDWFLNLGFIRAITDWLRGFLITFVFIPIRNFLLYIPTLSIVLLMAALGYAVGGWKSALFSGGCFFIIALTGWWDRAMITLYAVLTSVVIASLIGLPLGIFASRNPRRAKRVLLICDTAQTFPSFIYLIPAIMLFGVNDVAVIFAIVIFATVPLVRYTIEALNSVPAEMIEAAKMSGSTRSQTLWKVQFPLGLPTMAIGFNQTIMFSFFMVIIAAFIGTQGLGQELQRTLAGNQLGKNFVLGMCVSLMALSIDNIVTRWAKTRKEKLGMRN